MKKDAVRDTFHIRSKLLAHAGHIAFSVIPLLLFFIPATGWRPPRKIKPKTTKIRKKKRKTPKRLRRFPWASLSTFWMKNNGIRDWTKFCTHIIRRSARRNWSTSTNRMRIWRRMDSCQSTDLSAIWSARTMACLPRSTWIYVPKTWTSHSPIILSTARIILTLPVSMFCDAILSV